MYYAMNRFTISNDHIDDFINIWKSRNSLLDQVAGFKDFKLLQGPQEETSTLFVSHSIWESHAEFQNWTKSENFKSAHRGAKAPEGTYLGHPKFEGFKVILDK
jgi:heme-degrading monooxygenase HmoA